MRSITVTLLPVWTSCGKKLSASHMRGLITHFIIIASGCDIDAHRKTPNAPGVSSSQIRTCMYRSLDQILIWLSVELYIVILDLSSNQTFT